SARVAAVSRGRGQIERAAKDAGRVTIDEAGVSGGEGWQRCAVSLRLVIRFDRQRGRCDGQRAADEGEGIVWRTERPRRQSDGIAAHVTIGLGGGGETQLARE